MELAYDFNIQDLIDAGCDLAQARQLDIDNMIFQETIETSDFASKHYIQTGIEHNTPIIGWEQPKNWDFLKKSSDLGCDWNSCTLSSEPTKKLWSPHNYDCSLEFCWNDPQITKNFRAFWKLKCQSDPELEFDNAFYQFVISQTVKAVNDSMWRIAYFDYKDNTNTDFAGIDNIFLKLLGILADPVLAAQQRVTITQNSAADIAAQMTLPADAGYKYFKQMYTLMLTNRPYMMSKPGLKFRVTQELALNYLMWLQDNKEVNCCFSPTDGVTSSKYSLENLNYMGIPIQIEQEWTELIKHLEGPAATKYDKPHRALLTYDTEISVGTCDMNAFKQMKRIYDPVTEKLHIRVKTNLDIQATFDKNFILAI
ncbi:hypothetical protein [Chryseobacterium culicis]|uniref:hypothetical protein n=1 Tax=Chryseobacterium culicis TaxID=680127 RepID=UPI0018741E8F|nr:hypothetical protein [Chryseobacterium culicis]MBE4949901.1 hypothetical protein [Chryseobacterium culicis]